MEELNLTEGPWVEDRYNVVTKDDDLIARSYRGIDSIEDRANVQAIVTAVNETWHKGIDPEAVEDMKKALMIVLRTQQQNYGNATGLHLDMIDVAEEVKKALKKAGANLNEKAE